MWAARDRLSFDFADSRLVTFSIRATRALKISYILLFILVYPSKFKIRLLFIYLG